MVRMSFNVSFFENIKLYSILAFYPINIDSYSPDTTNDSSVELNNNENILKLNT